MVSIHKTPDVTEKLKILSKDSQYDLACACGTNEADRRHRSQDGKWIYPVSLPNGGQTILFKTLLSNHCTNNCKYCPLRVNQDAQRCTLNVEETVKTFLSYYESREVFGLFLSSGVIGTPDNTMARINAVARALRQRRFRGYMHLKVIPGASDAAITETVSLASAVSINIETAGEENFKRLCTSKKYMDDIIRPLKLISQLTAKGTVYSGVKQTTQFIVGASQETDQEIVKYSGALYKNLGLSRVYFNAYQRGLGATDLPGENSVKTSADIITREHRLYQSDWLVRKYGFKADEIPFGNDGNLSLEIDPKEMWAKQHPEFFPVNVNLADKYRLLRVPGLGEITIKQIFMRRKCGQRLRSLNDIGKIGKLLKKAEKYITF
ncbi:MAG: radical SAM protein [PVC group bacterium]|nr:radical SAM protein [PVC group bacterium]